MRVSLHLSRLHPMEYAPLVVKAEASGFEMVSIADHLIIPVAVASRYPYSESGDSGIRPETPFCDVWSLLGHLAATTSRIRLATGVFILPLRDPFPTARAAATVQDLSGGRFAFGVGTGWLRDEFEAVGQGWENRGARTDEIIDVLRGLWSGEPFAHDGPHYRFPSVRFSPAPTVPVPIWVGGTSGPALRRAAERGDGWYGPECSLEEAARVRDVIERARSGREGRPFEYVVRLAGDPRRDTLDAFQRMGFDHVVVPLRNAPGGGGPEGAEARLRAVETVAATLIG